MENTTKNQIERLMELKKLYESGILTREEMEEEKAKILGLDIPKQTDSAPDSEGSKGSIQQVEQDTDESNVEESAEEQSFVKKNEGLVFVCVLLGIVGIYFLFTKVILPLRHATEPTQEETLLSEFPKDNIALKGTINGNVGFTMHLRFFGKTVNGTEHYDNQPSDAILRIEGFIDENGEMTLEEYDGSSAAGKFVGILDANGYVGSFRNSKGNYLSFNASVLDEKELEQMEADERVFETQETCFKKNERGVNVEITVDYPIKANSKLLKSSQNYVNRVIAGMFDIEQIQGGLQDNQAVINTLGKEKYLKLRKEKDADGSPDGVLYEETITVEKCFDNDKCVSYRASSYYCHGGVGNSFCTGRTFRKNDGKEITIIKNANVTGFKAALIRAVKEKLGEEYELVAQFKEDFEDNPMPQELPHIVNEGVEFNYQHYEIGPGSFGQITVVIPFSEIMTYMTNEAKNILK